MANSKQLTATVRLNANQAERTINNLVNKINRINSEVKKVSNNKVNQQLRRANDQTNSIRHRVLEWAHNQRRVNNNLLSTNRLFTSILSKLRLIASTYLGIMGVRALVNVSDTVTKAENKLNYVSSQALGAEGVNEDGSYSAKTLATTQEALDQMYYSSQKVRMSYTDMMSNVSKSMALAGDSFDNNIDSAIRFQEIMAESYALGGASAQEMSSSMYQLIQALGAGILAGDELRSVREGAPLAYKAIEKYAQGVMAANEATKDLAKLSLKDLASEGYVTSDMVVAAIMDAGDELDNAFAQTAQTFEQTWEIGRAHV